jgi:hypothetical protein
MLTSHVRKRTSRCATDCAASLDMSEPSRRRFLDSIRHLPALDPARASASALKALLEPDRSYGVSAAACPWRLQAPLY